MSGWGSQIPREAFWQGLPIRISFFIVNEEGKLEWMIQGLDRVTKSTRTYKVVVLSWKLLQDRLLDKKNLFRCQIMSIDNCVGCAVYLVHMELVDNLFDNLRFIL